MTEEREPEWLDRGALLTLYREQAERFGGVYEMRDEGLFESALMRPQNAWAYSDVRPDLAALAAAYACGISANHPFVDGNKRMAYLAAVLFLRLNGYDMHPPPEDAVAAVLAVAAGGMDETAFAAWLRERMVLLA